MDSVTQAALGAAIGVATMGRRYPVWRSALAGAVLGTLPDLDILIDKGNAIQNMVLHRAETHAFFWQILSAPIFAGLLARFMRPKVAFVRWLAVVILVFTTHAMLDGMTVYGTRLGLPFTDYPFAAGSLFIIDLAYTIPLLVGLGLTLLSKKKHRWKWNRLGLAVSTAYAAWSLAAQEYVMRVIERTPEAEGLTRSEILITPTPFNTVLWRVVLRRQDYYEEGYYSLLDSWRNPDRPVRFERFDRGWETDRRTAEFENANLIRQFTRGFFSLADDGKDVRITDLRMGWHPNYVFSFVIAQHQSDPIREVEPYAVREDFSAGEMMGWMWKRVWGEDSPPPR